MSNLPLQPLVWSVDEYTGEPASSSLLHGYIIMNDGDGKFKVAYYLLSGGTYTKFATGFATIDDAKAWAWNHYNEKMQPYVKQMPTWIDASKQLPDSEGLYMVYVFDGHRDENVTDILYWNPDHQQFLEWDFMNNVTHWMPLPDAPKEISNESI